jgi:gluconolactonase
MFRPLPVLAAALAALLCPLSAADDYPLTPDSKPQDGVPKGEVLKFSFANSKIFPGTTRDYWVYVPQQYDPAKPACVYVNQDGIQYQAPVVFDNLIAKGEMPVTIGVFVMHGKVMPHSDQALPRFNRSYEYDGLGDNYARFLLEELLPEVETKKTSDGRAIRLSTDGNDRAIGGGSSGAVCAFTAAWERPDAFTRVFSSIGTYVGLRGGNEYPTLVRKYEPKPIRVFLQDGSNDLNIYAGDWWMVNQEMQRALTFAGYEVQHVWGDGGHNGKHATAIFPDAMRFLWKGWPEKVKAGAGSSQLKEILSQGEDWQPEASAGDLPVSARSVKRHDGSVYETMKHAYPQDPGAVILRPASGSPRTVDTGLGEPTGITLSPDQSLLYVADAKSHWVYSYQIQPDGSLAHKQRFYWLHLPDDADRSEAGSMCVDTAGRLYVATNLGLQICDQAGRVNCILPLPGGAATEVSFGGSDGTTLFARAGEKVFRRKVQAKGVDSTQPPIKPAAPRL